jgi:hypothetical protein
MPTLGFILGLAGRAVEARRESAGSPVSVDEGGYFRRRFRCAAQVSYFDGLLRLTRAMQAGLTVGMAGSIGGSILASHPMRLCI